MTHRQKHKSMKRPRSWHHRGAGPDRAWLRAIGRIEAALSAALVADDPYDEATGFLDTAEAHRRGQEHSTTWLGEPQDPHKEKQRREGEGVQHRATAAPLADGRSPTDRPPVAAPQERGTGHASVAVAGPHPWLGPDPTPVLDPPYECEVDRFMANIYAHGDWTEEDRPQLDVIVGRWADRRAGR